MSIRRRLLSVLLVLVFIVAPVFADVDWRIGKTLGDVPHEEIRDPFLTSMTRGIMEKHGLEYPANLEMVVEHAGDAFHPLAYTLYVYENPHAYAPASFNPDGNIEIAISDRHGNDAVLHLTRKTYGNRIKVDGINALAFSEFMFGTDCMDIEVRDSRKSYAFSVDTRSYVSGIIDIMLQDGAVEEEIRTLLDSDSDIADFVARNMAYVVNTPSASVASFENLLTLMLEHATLGQVQGAASVLWERDFYDWISYFSAQGNGRAVDEDKAEAVLRLIAVGRTASRPVLDDEYVFGYAPADDEAPVEPEVVEIAETKVDEPVEEAVAVIEDDVDDQIVMNGDEGSLKNVYVDLKNCGLGVDVTYDPEDSSVYVTVEGNGPAVEPVPAEEIAADEPADDIRIDAAVLDEKPVGNKHFYASLKSYGLGADITYDSNADARVSLPLGAALDLAFFGGHHGVSIEAAYVYADKAHTLEPGLSYLYKLQKSNRADIDFRLGAIANMKKVSYEGEDAYGFAFGGRLGMEMNFFMAENFFFNAGMHVRGLSPVYVFKDGMHAAGTSWNLDFELGLGIGVAF